MAMQNCLVCGTPTTKLCLDCNGASYCTEAHQQKDWLSHKKYCLKVKMAGANTVNAILFAEDETKPRFVKVPCKLIRRGRYTTSYEKLDTSIWFKNRANKAVTPAYSQVWERGINGPKLGLSLCLMYDGNTLIKGSPLNRCIMDVTGGRASFPWCGNILALRMGSSYNYDFYADVDMEEDLKMFVAYFEQYGKVILRRRESTCCGCTIA